MILIRNAMGIPSGSTPDSVFLHRTGAEEEFSESVRTTRLEQMESVAFVGDEPLDEVKCRLKGMRTPWGCPQNM